MTLLRSLILSVICLLLGWTPGNASNKLMDLTREVALFQQQLEGQTRVRPKPEHGQILLQAAELMTSEKECGLAYSLYWQALKLGVTPDYAVWEGLSRASFCSSQWRYAATTGYLAALATEDPRQRARSLRRVAEALEQRSHYRNDWTPAALAVYEMLLDLEDTVEIEEKIRQLKQKTQQLQLVGHEVSEQGSQPGLCLQFNHRLNTEDSGSLEEYIRISPQPGGEFRVRGREVCIDGAQFGTTYTLTLLKGLPGTGSVLPESTSFTMHTGHRDPALWFETDAYVLPLLAETGIGLHSVNVKTARLELYRIQERNLLSGFVQSKFRRKLNRNEMEQIRDTVGELVWEGMVDLPGEQDQVSVNSLELPQKVLKEPGLYALTAVRASEQGKRWQDNASQWLVITDIGLTTYQGNDGLTVVARSLATARSFSGLSVSLFSRNNKELAVVRTDEQGRAHFPAGLLRGKGGSRPALVVAQDQVHGFTFLPLETAPFDLSDRGVAGRMPPTAMDAYLHTDRGIYRPGGQVNLVGLVRDGQGRALQAPPLTLQLRRPDGKIAVERLLHTDTAGALVSSLALPQGARTGNWQVLLFADPDRPPVGRTAFEVDAFTPPRLEIQAEVEGMITRKARARVVVSAEYLYGAPGSGLQVEAQFSLTPDPRPFTEFDGYLFGREDEQIDFAVQQMEETRTDDAGVAVFSCGLDEFPGGTRPVRATVALDVVDIDGRTVAHQIQVPVRHLDRYVGIKPGFSGKKTSEESMADFEVIVLDGQGKPLPAAQLSYRLVKEDIDYQWFSKGGEWSYQRVVREHQVLQQPVEFTSPGHGKMSVPVQWGGYRFEVLDHRSTPVASWRFWAGQGRDSADIPDAVQVSTDRKNYLPGETARLRLQAPFTGEATLVLAGTGVHQLRSFSLNTGEHELTVPVTRDWGAGVYALVTVYRPGESKAGPGRAMGLVWLGVDHRDQQMEVRIETPEKTAPRKTLEVPVQVAGVKKGEKASLVLAAVDAGVLEMTGHPAPDPLSYFFGQQQLGTDIRDLYGRLISGPGGKPLPLRSGGGDDALRGMVESNVRVVALFSGTVAVGPDGRAVVPLELPDINGRLRLTAMAWSVSAMGAASKELTVRDAVVLSPSLPRFLARDDRSSMHLLIENMDGDDGEYLVTATAAGAVAIKGESVRHVVLTQGQRQGLSYDLRAEGVGSGTLTLAVKGPGSYTTTTSYSLNVRDKYLPVLRRTFVRLAPQQGFTVPAALISDLHRDTVTFALSVSSTPNLDVPGLLAQLKRYPYGCLEQVTSRAMPLLYADSLARQWHAGNGEDNLDGRLAEAVTLVLEKQREDGSFGLWSGQGETDPWLSAYAMDFLARARKKQILVADTLYEQGLQWLSKRVRAADLPKDTGVAALAYAHWVLARENMASPEDVRYLFDTLDHASLSSQALAHLGGTLTLLGDNKRGSRALNAALQRGKKQGEYWSSYGSRIRDLAVVISIIDECGSDIDPAQAWEELTREVAATSFLSTQEQAWLILAALTLEGGAPLDLRLDDQPVAMGQQVFTLGEARLGTDGGPYLVNTGKHPVWLSATVKGLTIEPPPLVAKGFSLKRSWFTLDGTPVDRAAVLQGDMVVVLLRGEVTKDGRSRALVVDLLPAGFEIMDSRLKNRLGTIPGLSDWLPELSPTQYIDGLDDRFVAALDTDDLPPPPWGEKHLFRLAYLMRAIFPGNYTLPPAEVEDMYQPASRATTTADQVIISR